MLPVLIGFVGGVILTFVLVETVPLPLGVRRRRAVRLAKAMGIDLSGRDAGGLHAVEEGYRALTRSFLLMLIGIGVMNLVLLTGPALSTSTVTSVAVAGSGCAGLLAPLLLLRGYQDPLGTSFLNRRRPVGVDDYLAPLERVLVWLAVAGACAAPLGAVVLAMSPVYDGAKLFWEGLIGFPLVAVVVLIALERGVRGVRDDASWRPGLLLRDSFRSAAMRLLAAACVLAAVVTWQVVSGALTGVGLREGPVPEHVVTVQAWANLLQRILLLLAVVLIYPSTRRSRRMLWPGLDRDERLRWVAVGDRSGS